MSASTSQRHDGSPSRSATGAGRSAPAAPRDEVEMSPAELAKVLRNVADRLDAVLDVSERPAADTARLDAARPAGSAPSTGVPRGDERGSEAEKPEGSENIDTLVLRLSQERAASGSDAPAEVEAAEGTAVEPTVPDATAPDAKAWTADASDAKARETTASASAASETTAHPNTSSVDAQLDSVRRRMKERRAVVAVDDVPKRRWRPWPARTDPQAAASHVVRRLLLVAAIVAVSAAASLAVF